MRVRYVLWRAGHTGRMSVAATFDFYATWHDSRNVSSMKLAFIREAAECRLTFPGTTGTRAIETMVRAASAAHSQLRS